MCTLPEGRNSRPDFAQRPASPAAVQTIRKSSAGEGRELPRNKTRSDAPVITQGVHSPWATHTRGRGKTAEGASDWRISYQDDRPFG